MGRRRGWSDDQDRIIRATYHMDAVKVRDMVNSTGCAHTLNALYKRRFFLRRVDNPHGLPVVPTRKLTHAGWPELEGTHEERDRLFVRLVIAEAFRLGLIKVDRGAPGKAA